MAEKQVATDIAANVARVRERIARAAERAGRQPEDILLVGASKLMDADRVRRAIAAGLTDIGENYVQEAAQKRAEVGADARWHMVGHLQRNKAGQAVEIFDMVQTVDSPRLARALARRAEAAGRTLEVLLQVNTSGEESKFGAAPEELEALAEAVAQLPSLRAQGLMTIGRWDPDPDSARPEFRLLRQLSERLQERDDLDMRWLSMGMSHDFEVAIEEGANLVRVGTAIFGPRPE